VGGGIGARYLITVRRSNARLSMAPFQSGNAMPLSSVCPAVSPAIATGIERHCMQGAKDVMKMS
jgi:hypothetical protein